MTMIPKFEPLEDRIVLDGADPELTIVRNGEGPLELGEQDVEYTLTFDNVGTDSGYVPYVDLIVPSGGDDGDDGPTFDSASFLGGSIDTTLVTFDASGEAEHPFLLNPDGSAFIVTGGEENDTLVVFELPYGSFSPGNPAVDIIFSLDYSSNAELTETPTLQAIGGFALGCDALDNPDTDPPVRDAVATTLTEDQQLFTLEKTNNVPEAEAATGPSYIYQYTLTVDVAAGQALDNFTLTDTLPPEIVYVGNPVVTGGAGGTVTTEPPLGAQVTAPDNQLVVDFTEVTDTVTVVFDYYISNDPSDEAIPTNDPDSGAQTPVTNELTGTGTWDPSDGDDPQNVTVSASDTDIIQATTLAVQKSVAVFADNNAPGASSLDEYEFTLEVQVSDYFTFGDLVLTDVMGDGWNYVDNSAEFTTSEEIGSIATTALGVDEIDTFDPATGETTLVFELSDAMVAAGQDALLTGDIAGDGTSSGSQTTVTITYRATIANEFTDTGSGLQQISQGDTLSNMVEISGTVRDNDTGDVEGTVVNESATETPLARGEIREKTVFALNGDTNPPADVVIAAGDTVTFSVIYDAPLGAFENFTIVDNLPQLVFDSTEVTTFTNPPPGPGAVPPAGTAYFGDLDTFFSNASTVPTIDTTQTSDNQVDFVFGDLTLPTRDAVVVHILFTVTVEDANFAPDLFLTNQATAYETNTNGDTISSTAIAQFNYAEPDLNISKGVIATDRAGTLTGDTGPAATAPGTGGFRFDPLDVNSDDLAATPIDGDIANVDAGDLVSFAIVVENTGGAPNGAFNISLQDTLPDGFEIPATGLNLNVSDGNGTTIPFTLPDGTSAATANDLFGAGIMLTDDAALVGAASVFDATSGENVIIVTYDLLVSGDVSPSDPIVNTATLATYSAFEGDGNFDGVDPPLNRADEDDTDDAQATTTSLEITKTLNTREFEADFDDRNGIGFNGSEVAVGEDFSFIIRLDIPEGELYNTVISDAVNDGNMQIVSATIETIGGGVTNDEGLVVGDTATIAPNGAGNDAWSFDFGTVTAAPDNIIGNDFIEIRVVANVPDATGDGADERESNVARIDFQNASGDAFSDTDDAAVRVIEPNLTFGKIATPLIVTAGGLANYEVTVENVEGARDAPAFDLVIGDTLDPEIALDPATIEVRLNGVVILDAATQTFTDPDGQVYSITTPIGGDTNSFEIFADELHPDDILLVNYSGNVSDTVATDQTLLNTAGLVYDSTPEDNVGDPDSDDREYGATAVAPVVTLAPTIDKSIVSGSTSYAETAGTELGIGETLTYEFVVFIPEGSISDVVVFDDLPDGLEYVSSSVIRIGDGADTNISGGSLNVGDSAMVTGQLVEFDFGDLTNLQNGNTGTEDELVVQITVRVTGNDDNTTGDDITNEGQLSFTNGDDETELASNEQTITLVEPDMSIDKAVVPSIADAGDTVQYTITATNDGTGPAYDMIISDDVVGPAISADQASVLVTYLTDTGAAFTPVEAAIVSFNIAGELQVIVPDLPAGHEVVITYDAVVQDSALFSTSYINTAEIERYDSNPAGTATTPSADPDEDDRVYAGPSDTAVVATPDVSLTKEFFSSGDTNTADPAGGANAQLAVGEVVTYELVITVPQGTADIVLTDNLPAGLLAQSAQVISVGDALTDTADLSAGDTQTDGNITINAARDSVEFDFGTVVIEGSDDAAAGTTQIVVRVTSIVDDVAAATQGMSLTNTATLELSDPDGGALQPDVTASETVDVIEPDLAFEKTGEVAGDIGDTVTYVITATNNGDAPAYDVLVSDPLGDPNLTYEGGSATVAIDGTDLIPQPTIIIPAPGQTGGFAFDGLTVLPNEVLTVTFDARISATAPTAETFTNTSSVAYDTVPGDPVDADGNPTGQDYSDTDDHDVATSPSITKTPFTSGFTETDSELGDDPFDLSIGETVTFRFEITLPEIAFDGVTASDLLPAGLEFVSATVVDVNGTGAAGTVSATPDVGNPNLILLDFGGMTNASDGSIGDDDVLVFDVVARVTNDGIPEAGDTLTNTITLNADPTGDDAFAPVVATAEVNIVEPELTIEKSGPLAIDADGMGDFEIVVTNTGVAGAEGPAFDIDISDSLPADMELFPGTLVFTDGDGNVVTPTTLVVTTTSFTARFEFLDVDQSITVNYTAELNVNAQPLTEFVNTATADFFSAPDDLLDAGGNAVAEDYTPVSDTARFFTGPTLEKNAISSDIATTPDDADGDMIQEATIGETVTFELVLTLPEIPMDVVVLNDMLPAGLSFVSAEVTAVGSEITVDGDTSVADVNAGATFLNVGQNLTVTFDDVINAYVDGVINQGQDAIVVQVTARIEDVAAVMDGGTLTNMADLTITPEGQGPMNTVMAEETIEIVNPDITVDKTSTIAVNPGDNVDYVVVATNEGTSPAYDVSFADTFGNPLLSLNATPPVMVDLDGTDITADLTIVTSGDGFTFDLVDAGTGTPFVMPVGSVLTVTYQATLDISAPEAQTFPNTAEVNFDNLSGDPVDENGDPIDGRDYTAEDQAAVATVPFLTKTPTASNFGETDSVDGSDPFDLAIGEEVTYTYDLYLPEIDMSSVFFMDDLPPGLEFISLNVESYGTGLTDLSGNPIVDPTAVFDPTDDSKFSLNFGDIRNPEDTDPPTIGTDDIITITVVARVTGEPSAGDTLTNETSLTVTPVGLPALATAENSADVRVVEPELTQEKTGPLAIDPGDTATFVVTTTNSGPDVIPAATGPAYDVSIVDVLPAEMTLDPATISITLNGVLLDPATDPTATLTSSGTGFTLLLDVIDADDVVEITYDAALDLGANPISSFLNTVTTNYDSAPGDVLDGEGNPIQKDYDPVETSHATASQPTLEKDSISSQFDETPEDTDGDDIRDLAIGETTTYELVLTLPEIPMDRVQLTDLLPEGLTFVSAELTELGSALSVGGSTDLATINAGISSLEIGQLLRLRLDDVVNTDRDGQGTRDIDALVFEIVARVDAIPENNGNGAGTQLTNTAGLIVTPQDEEALDEIVATETVEIVEPNLELVKTGEITGDRGAETDYTITITNNGNGAAVDTAVTDTLSDPFLTLGSTPITAMLDGVPFTPTIVTPATGETDGFTIPGLILQPGEVLVITVPVLIEANTPDAVTLTNTAGVVYDGLPGDPMDENGDPVDDRDYSDSDDHLIVTSPGIDKTPFTSNIAETDSEAGDSPFELTIGETVTYRYTLTLPEIGMDSVIVTDLLPEGLEFVSVNVVSVNGTGASGTVVETVDGANPNLITFDFGAANNAVDGSIGADDMLVFDVTALVLNNGSSNAGEVKTNTATLDVDPTGADPFAPIVTSADVAIVEPSISIEKTGPFAIDPGAFGDYTITVTNDGLNGAPGPAFDVDITDALPTSLILDQGSIVVTLDGVVVTPTTVTTSPSGFTVEFDVIPASGEVVIDYRAQLDPSVEALTVQTNTATAVFSSAPDTIVDGMGNPTGTVYPLVSDDHILSTIPTLEKNAVSTGYAETADDADGDDILELVVGETVTYELILTLPEIPMDVVTLTDLLPAGMEFVSANVTFIGSEITISGATAISDNGQLVTIELTDVFNQYVDGTITQAEDAIVIEITTRVTDVPVVQDGAQLTNQAGLVVVPQGETALQEIVDTATVEIIEPDIGIVKTTDALEPFLGDIITYTVVVINDGDATAPAFNSVVTDTLPTGLELVGTPVLSDPTLGSVSDMTTVGGDTLLINIPVLQPGESLTITYEAFVGYTTNVLDPLFNTADVTTSSSPDADDGFGRDYGDQDDVAIIPTPVPELPTGRPSHAINGIDDAQFLPVLLIDPIFTGTAEPGANVTINLYRSDGTLDYVRNIVSDAGGHWIAIFPRTELGSVEDDFHETHANSVLFDAPVRLLDQSRYDTMNLEQTVRTNVVGSNLNDQAYTLGINVDRPSTLPDHASLNNSRIYFAPSHIGEVYGRSISLDVGEVFDNVAFRTVQDLYSASSDPLGVSLNRFNYEFLGDATAVPGAQ